MNQLNEAALAFGGSNAYSGVSTSRTLMLRELTSLLASVPQGATRDDYRVAIVDENVLLKPSIGTRAKTWSYLRDRFALDPDVPVFQLLRLLWDRDPAGQPLMALLVAMFRDPVLRATIPVMLQCEPDQAVTSADLGQEINTAFPGKLKAKTLESTGENTTSTFLQSGHLVRRGRASVRRRVVATPGSTTLALLLATLGGAGGYALLEGDWVRLLDSPDEMILSEARIASSRGWLEFRHAGNVLEISFHQLLASIGASQ